ncbi:glycosyltransferase family 2 protein [Cupriavidus basilensis]|uniref:glycosyltransferase family 2 protein n=1 Tax=Cupriavidus basilensis TaxID=68895 RepID=UPI000ABD4FAD|nr:glycosyltransferase family 2 protein [Cupriavidus basilensis]
MAQPQPSPASAAGQMQPRHAAPGVSVLILTRNEEQDLPGCLQSVAWSDDIHVYDSMSTDATVQIARRFGAHVTQRPFDNWASHQNWGLRHIRFRHPWVFYIDADERMTPALVEQVCAAARGARDEVAYRVRRRDFFLGTWLRHVQAAPFYLRLFRPERMRYERLVNPTSIPDGPVGELSGYLDHFPFSKGLSHWIARHNGYSSLEAQQTIDNRRGKADFSLREALFARDFHRRRAHQKELFFRLPLRPLAKFLLLYLGKRGFLDGRAGLTYAILQSIYEYFIVIKTRELRAQATAAAAAADGDPAAPDLVPCSEPALAADLARLPAAAPAAMPAAMPAALPVLETAGSGPA